MLGPVAVDDTFRGSAVDSGTWAVSDGTTGSGLQLRPSAVSVRNDALEITTSMDGDEKVSGGVVLRDAQTYGRYEIRAHMTTAASVTGTLNVRASGSGFGSGGALSFSVAGMQWRTFVIDWTPGEIKLLRDGVVISTVTETGADEVPDDARALALEVDPASHELSAPASMEIGSVKVRTYQGC